MANEETAQIMGYAQEKFEQSTPLVDETAIVSDTPVDEAPVATDNTEIVDSPATTDTETTPTTSTEFVAPDYGKILDEISGGLFKDVDNFKLALPKINEYEALSKSKAELEEKISSYIKPANDFAKTINDMASEGKTLDDIENFIKISKVDLDTISPIEAKVMLMVKQGYNENIAREIVDQEFPLNDYEEGTTERNIIQEKLRVSALSDKEQLKAYKKEFTAVDNSAAVEAENKRLEQVALKAQQEQIIKQSAPKIAEAIVGLGEINLNGKEGEEAKSLKFDYPQEFKANLPQQVENFFLESQLPLTDENVAMAKQYIEADYLQKNKVAVFQSIFKHAEAITTEKMVNKYENRTGLPSETVPVVVDTTQSELTDFMNKVAGKR